jgi:hypothetical protein
MSGEKASLSRKLAAVFPLTEGFLGKLKGDLRRTGSLLGKSAPAFRLRVALLGNTRLT